MNKLLLSSITLTLALQPVLAFAYTIKGVDRVSRRTLVNEHRESRKQHAGTKTTTMPSANSPAVPYNNVGDFTPALPATGYSLGDVDAPITVVEFVDYACPFCTTFALKTMPTIQARYIKSGKVRFVFRNYPLSFHAAASVAAQAVECSREQSESYALTLQKKLFEAQADGEDLTADEVYDAFSALKGIDLETMYYCIDTGATLPQITQDMTDATAGGIGGVPAFWVLGPKGKTVLVQGAQDFASFKKVFDTLLK